MARENESSDDRSERADFGPSPDDAGAGFSDFGPSDAGFGDPDSAFGPGESQFGPADDDTGAQWSPPPMPENPGLAWRPASESGPDTSSSVPPPPQQYRAPGSTSSSEMSMPQYGSAPDSGDEATVRHRIEPDDTATVRQVRHPIEQPTVRHHVGDEQRTAEIRSQSPASPTAVESSEVSARPGRMSWDDDPIAQQLTPQSVTAARSRRAKRPSARILVLGGALVAVAVLVGSIVLLTGRGNPEPPALPDATSAALSCPSTQDGKMTVGNGTGDTRSGTGAILGFQHAFYVERDAQGVREFAAPDAENISSAEVMQRAIDAQIPQGTTHCLRIVEQATGTFDVDLTEHRPNGTTTVYQQTVITVQRDGKTVLFAINERG